jgi:hypothetical protein
MRQSVQDDSPNRTIRGRPFVKGNPGRRLGSKNRETVIATSLLEGETEELLRKAVALAKGGNVPMLKFCSVGFSRVSGSLKSICQRWTSPTME